MKNTKGAGAQGNAAPEEYDLVILGSGVGAKLSAWTFASRGQRVAVVERKYVGGSCPNIACLPSKNIIHTAQVASYVRRSGEFGIAREGFRVDMVAVRDRKRKMVAGLVETHLDEYRQSGAELIMGTGRFIGPRTVEVTLNDGGRRLLRGTNVVIGTRQRPDTAVINWLDRQARTSVWTTSNTVLEIRFGLQVMTTGKRRSLLIASFERLLAELIQQRIAPFDGEAAQRAADLMATRQKKGRSGELRRA